MISVMFWDHETGKMLAQVMLAESPQINDAVQHKQELYVVKEREWKLNTGAPHGLDVWIAPYPEEPKPANEGRANRQKQGKETAK